MASNELLYMWPEHCNFFCGVSHEWMAAGTGALPRVWEGIFKGVASDALPNPVQSGERRVGEGGRREGGGDDPRTFRMLFTAKVVTRPCQVEGCSGRVATRMEMWVHLWHRYVQDTVVILE